MDISKRSYPGFNLNAILSGVGSQLIVTILLYQLINRQDDIGATEGKTISSTIAEDLHQLLIQPLLTSLQPGLTSIVCVSGEIRNIPTRGDDVRNQAASGTLRLTIVASAFSSHSPETRLLHLKRMEFQSFPLSFLILIASAKLGLPSGTSDAQRSAEDLSVVIMLRRIIGNRLRHDTTLRVDVADDEDAITVSDASGSRISLKQLHSDIRSSSVRNN